MNSEQSEGLLSGRRSVLALAKKLQLSKTKQSEQESVVWKEAATDVLGALPSRRSVLALAKKLQLSETKQSTQGSVVSTHVYRPRVQTMLEQGFIFGVGHGRLIKPLCMPKQNVTLGRSKGNVIIQHRFGLRFGSNTPSHTQRSNNEGIVNDTFNSNCKHHGTHIGYSRLIESEDSDDDDMLNSNNGGILGGLLSTQTMHT